MTQEELLNIVHELRNNKDCSDEQLCEVIKAANQTINFENIAKLIGERPATEENEGKKAAVKFTQQEINRMPQKFKKIFKFNNLVAHIIMRKGNVYEVRCMIDGVRYSGSSKNLATAKAKFIDSLIHGGKRRRKPAKPKVMFNDYFLRWLETVKKPYIKESTYAEYTYYYRANITPTFEGKEIEEIDSFFLQQYINSFTSQRHFRTAVKIYNLLMPCFKYAVADGVIPRNPMDKIVLPKYDKRVGMPLTRVEERYLLDELQRTGSIYAQALVFLLYTGLRVGELASVTMEGDWVRAVSLKGRKGLKDKIRRIPVSPNLKRFLPLIQTDKIVKLSSDAIARHVKDYFEGHRTHDLRHTFITRAQEVAIRREIVSLWVGHAPDSSVTSLIYTHLEFNEQLQLDEIAKFDYVP